MRDQEQLALLVAEIATFLQSWQSRLNAGSALDAAESSTQAATANLLSRRAAQLGSGGLAHHLARCSEALHGTPPSNLPALREALRAVSEISWQLREELRASQRAQPFVSQVAVAIAPVAIANGKRSPLPAAEPEPPPRLTEGGQPPVPNVALAQSILAPPMLSASVLAPLPLEASSSASREHSAPPADEREPLVASDAAKEEPSRNRPGLIATLFGLRGLGRSATSARRSVDARQAPVPAADVPASLFKFRAASAARSVLAPPPLVSVRDGLPPLAGARAESGAPTGVNADLDARLQQLRPAARPNRKGARAKRRHAGPDAAPHAIRGSSRSSWGIVLLITVPVGLLLGNAFLILDHRLRERERTPETVSLALDSAPEGRLQSAPLAADPGPPQQLQALAARIHGLGGAESPELSALLDTEASAAYRALAQSCGGSVACESQRLAQDLLSPHQLPAHAARLAGPPPRWMAGLTIPAIGAHDHPEVQRWLEYYTGHSVGRELFQTMLFRCGAHQDLINKALIHHGLPLDLMAVVLTESACVSDAESGVGARGLWQFMASTARAYHLVVQEGVVDERLSPVKSTEAAVRFLGDLHRKMGSWEMAFASYNAGGGPFRMLARLEQSGAAATFWDLAEAQLIPEETARYVPRIQAYALILANLRHFDFSAAQMRTEEETADLEVPSRARLGQVARAAGTSVSHLRSLNPDLVGTVIPSLPGNGFVLQVPKASAFRARETLGQFLLEQLDQCVSTAFDWGREQFTAEMQAKCAARRSR